MFLSNASWHLLHNLNIGESLKCLLGYTWCLVKTFIFKHLGQKPISGAFLRVCFLFLPVIVSSYLKNKMNSSTTATVAFQEQVKQNFQPNLLLYRSLSKSESILRRCFCRILFILFALFEFMYHLL